MNHARPIQALLAAVGVLSLASCGTQTTLETSWSLPGAQAEPFSKLAIIGAMKNQKESRSFESAAVAIFGKDGVDAVPGFTFLNGKTDLSRDQLDQRVRGTGADGVLIFKVIAVDKSREFVPPTTYTTEGALHPEWWEDRYWGYYRPYPYHYWGYWYPAVQVVTTPGYWQLHKTYEVESVLYRVSDGRLIWSATSDTFDPTGQVDLGKSVTRPVLENLEAHHLVATG